MEYPVRVRFRWDKFSTFSSVGDRGLTPRGNKIALFLFFFRYSFSDLCSFSDKFSFFPCSDLSYFSDKSYSSSDSYQEELGASSA